MKSSFNMQRLIKVFKDFHGRMKESLQRGKYRKTP